MLISRSAAEVIIERNAKLRLVTDSDRLAARETVESWAETWSLEPPETDAQKQNDAELVMAIAIAISQERQRIIGVLRLKYGRGGTLDDLLKEIHRA